MRCRDHVLFLFFFATAPDFWFFLSINLYVLTSLGIHTAAWKLHLHLFCCSTVLIIQNHATYAMLIIDKRRRQGRGGI
jgi:hypothetical protein